LKPAQILILIHAWNGVYPNHALNSKPIAIQMPTVIVLMTAQKRDSRSAWKRMFHQTVSGSVITLTGTLAWNGVQRKPAPLITRSAMQMQTVSQNALASALQEEKESVWKQKPFPTPLEFVETQTMTFALSG